MIVFWIIVLYGITQIIVESRLFKPLRDLLKPIPPLHMLITCMICTGCWISIILSKVWWSPMMYITEIPLIINGYNISFFIDAMFGSCLVWFVSRIEQLIYSFSCYLDRK